MCLSGCVALWRSNVEGFHSADSQVIDGVWIYPELNGEGKSFDMIPIVAWGSEHAPYSVGISAVDHSNQYQRLEITELTLEQGKRSKIVVKKGAAISAPFSLIDQHPRTTTRRAMCVVNIDEWPEFTLDTQIHFSASFVISGTNRHEAGLIDTFMQPSIHKETGWFEIIHD